MTLYNVYFGAGASALVQVEAESRDEAEEKAWEFTPGSPCHQEDFELGDWDIDDVEEADE